MIANRLLRLSVPAVLLTLAGCAGDAGPRGAAAISADSLSATVETLSSDEFGGRGPSSPGEQTTIAYLQDRFRALGFQPANGESYLQPVPLVSITTPGAPLSVRGPGVTTSLDFAEGWVGWTKRVVPEAALDNSELVFVGYGIVAPEYGWDDYEGVDVNGKTVVILVNDPGYATEDEAVFRGRSMTYYGRWTYKFEEAARQGARGALIVHDTGPAGYGWGVVAGSWTGPQFTLAAADDNMSRLEIEGWISNEAAAVLFTAAGHDLTVVSERAAQPGFRALPLGLAASTRLTNTTERSNSNNVAAVLPGSTYPDEYLVYMAHWDHFGTSSDDSLEDRIFNGAFDNATGTAGLIEIGRAFASQATPPERSILLLALTGEEQGLLGSAYYGSSPLVPTNQTVAAINMDGLNVDGPMSDITVVGYGASDMDDLLEAAASAQGRSVRGDPEPEKGFYYRSDHFSLAKVGVPSLYTDSGIESVEHGAAWTLEQREDYTANRYHTPDDEFDANWDLSGAIEDLALLYQVGTGLASSRRFPEWKMGNEFKAIRDADRGGAAPMGN